MNQAHLTLWSVLQTRAHLDDAALACLFKQAAGELGVADPDQRSSDMQAAIGTWADRDDIPDSSTYLRNLRDDDRSRRPFRP